METKVTSREAKCGERTEEEVVSMHTHYEDTQAMLLFGFSPSESTSTN